MAIKNTITNEYEFADWLREARKRESSYGNSFSVEGAKAVQEYLEQLSEDIGEDIEFDPIAWCVEFTEYDSVAEAYQQYYGDASDLPEEQQRTTREQQLEWFEDNTTVIELDNGHIIVGEF